MVARTRAGGKWTEARYWAFIRSTLRHAWMKYPVKHDYKTRVRSEVEGQKHRFEYPCEECGGEFPDKEVQVDHIKPAGSLNNAKDLPGFVTRLFCEEDNLQILCSDCHKKKTAEDRLTIKRRKK